MSMVNLPKLILLYSLNIELGENFKRDGLELGDLKQRVLKQAMSLVGNVKNNSSKTKIIIA